LAWPSVAFLLCATATNLAWGRAYSNFNAKWLYIFSVFIFEVGSAICGAAPTMNILIVGRAIAGVGGSGQNVGCMTLIAATTTMAERPMYISTTGLSWDLGTVLGPILGGAFAQSSVGWRWGFYINLFVGAACAPAWLFLISSTNPHLGTPFRARAAEIDYAGITLQVGMLSALLLAVNLGGVTLPCDSGRIIALFVVSGMLFVTLGIQQVWNILTTEERRIIPVQFFRSRTVVIIFVCTATNGALTFVPTYMILLFFQFTRTDGPLDAGVRLFPLISILIVFISINGALVSKLGYYMPLYLVGGCFVVIGSALMYTIDQDDSESRVYGYTVLIGVGTGLFSQTGYAIAQAAVDRANVAPAIGFISTAQFVGISLSLALANAILLNGSQSEIQQILPDVSLADIQGAILGARSGLVQNLAPDVQRRVLGAIGNAIDQTYILVIAGGALAAAMSLAMRREKLLGGAAASIAGMG
jgi:MFS family permease